MEDKKKIMERLKNKVEYVSIEPIQTYPDPTDLIINLAILHFLPIGTKLHFYNGKIHIQEKGYYQSISRTLFNGSKKEIALYLVSLVHGFAYNNDPIMIKIHEYAILGLYKLNDTYGNEDCVYFNIDKCINFIKSFINKTKVYIFTRDTKIYTKNIKIIKIYNKEQIFKKFIKLTNEKNEQIQQRLAYKIIRLLHMNCDSLYGSLITPISNVMYNTIDKVSDNL